MSDNTPVPYRSKTPSKLDSSSSKAVRRIQEQQNQSAARVHGHGDVARRANEEMGAIHVHANTVFETAATHIQRDRPGLNPEQAASVRSFSNAQTTALGNQLLGISYLAAEKIADVVDDTLNPPDRRRR